MMPRQNCPVCGNSPRAFLEREKDNKIAALSDVIAAQSIELADLREQCRGMEIRETAGNGIIIEQTAKIDEQARDLERLRKFRANAQQVASDIGCEGWGKAGKCDCPGCRIWKADWDDDVVERAPTAQIELQASLPNEKQRGIYRKFLVERTDGSSRPGGKHERCEYFVLDWIHDKFAVPAARAYADACSREFPELARDLMATANEAEALRRIPQESDGGK